MPEQAVPLSQLGLDLPAPAAGGWAAELERRGIAVFEDDLGRPAIERSTARALFAEHRETEARNARLRAEIEERAVEAHQRLVASLPPGIPLGSTPEGVSPGLAMMLADSERQRTRRESPLEHALQNSGNPVYHPIREES